MNGFEIATVIAAAIICALALWFLFSSVGLILKRKWPWTGLPIPKDGDTHYHDREVYRFANGEWKKSSLFQAIREMKDAFFAKAVMAGQRKSQDPERFHPFGSECPKGLVLWTHDLVHWIGKTDNPVVLAVACALVIDNEWPKWLPGKPANPGSEGCSVYDDFIEEVYGVMKQRAEGMLPGVCSLVRLTNYHRHPFFHIDIKKEAPPP